MPEIPDVSVVIPTRNRWQFLPLALQSVLDQRGVSLEALVVDDGSRDETAARLAELDDARVRVFRNEVSHGVAAARNLGIRSARAPWVAFLDDDDLWAPDKLQRQLSAAHAARAEFAYGAVAYVNDALEVIEIVPPPHPDGLLTTLLPANAMPAGPSNVIARTDLLRRLDGFDESFLQVEDWDLWIRLAEAGSAAVCDEPLVAYRVHSGNITVRRQPTVLDEIDMLAEKHAGLESRLGVRVDRVLYTRWIASIHRRQGDRLAAAATYMRGAIRYRSPGNVMRAAGALVGERAMGLGRPRVDDTGGGGEVSWLERYRDSSIAASSRSRNAAAE